MRCPKCFSAVDVPVGTSVGTKVVCHRCGFKGKVQSVSGLLPGTAPTKETQGDPASSIETDADSAGNGSAPREGSPPDRESATSQLPKTLGRFQLRQRLGRGAFGEVWESIDTHLGRRVAIKLPIMSPGDIKRSRRFLIEARSAAKLGHPNIVAVYDAGVIGQQHYLAIEYIDGQSLDQHIQQQAMTQRDAAALIADLASALEYAHGEKIVHRDIKPQNIVITRQGTGKIVDFGLAKLIEQDAGQTVDGTILGTPAYMSPEQARGDIKGIGPHSDQYSLGAVLYWLLVGESPFIGPRMAVISQVIDSPPRPPSSVRPEIDSRLDAICSKTLSKHPKDRYASCADLAEDLRRFLLDADVLARPPTLVRRVARMAQRNPRESLLLGGLLLAFAILFSVTLHGLVRSWQLANIAADRKLQAERDNELQRNLEAELSSRLEEAKRAKSTALAARANAEEKKQQLVNASRDLDQLQSVLNTLDSEKKQTSEDLSNLGDLREQKRRAARQQWRADFAKDPLLGLNRIQALVMENKMDLAREQLGDVPESDRNLWWYILCSQVAANNVRLSVVDLELENPSSKSISGTWWDHRANTFHILYGDGSIEIRGGPDLAVVALFPPRSGNSRRGWLDRDQGEIVSWRWRKSFEKSANPIRLSIDAASSDRQLDPWIVCDNATGEYFALGLTYESKQVATGDQELQCYRLEGGTWMLQETEMFPTHFRRIRWIASRGSGHLFELDSPHTEGEENALPAYVALDLKPMSSDRIRMVAKDRDPWVSDAIDAASTWEDSQGSYLSVQPVREKHSQKETWEATLRYGEFETPLAFQGLRLESINRRLPQLYSDDARHIVLVIGNQVAVCALKGLDATLAGVPTNADGTLPSIWNSIGMELLRLPEGNFTMGESSENGSDGELHRVTLTRPFYMGVYEVTQTQFKQVMDLNPSYIKGFDHPVERVSWNAATEFCKRLSSLPAEREAGRTYRLPTEAEWEYACRAGAGTKFGFGDFDGDLADHAWFKGNAIRSHAVVGTKEPNRWGLYDMHGNVGEWCYDVYGPLGNRHEIDPTGPIANPGVLGSTSPTQRVARGGGWHDDAAACRSAVRFHFPETLWSLDIGFRVVMTSRGSEP